MTLQSYISSTLDLFKTCTNSGLYLIPFILCCFGLLLFGHSRLDKDVIAWFIYPSGIILFLLLNPLLMGSLMARTDWYRGSRFYWLLPIEIVVAYVLIRLIYSKIVIWLKVVVVAAFACLILVNGTYMFGPSMTFYHQRENWYKVPSYVIEICDVIDSDCPTEQKSVLASFSVAWQLRQYDPSIVMPFSGTGKTYSDRGYRLYRFMNSDRINSRKFFTAAKEFGCDYIVMEPSVLSIDIPDDCGYHVFTTVGDGEFTIFRADTLLCTQDLPA